MTNSLHHPGSQEGVCRAKISEGEGWVVAGRGFLQCTKHKKQTKITHANIPTGAVSCRDTRYRRSKYLT